MAESPFVESFFVWTEVGPQANKWLVFDQASKALPSGSAGRLHEDKVIGAQLLRRLRELVERKRAIVAFTETINGRPHYVQAQLRWEGPARERMTSVVGFAVDAERLRAQFIPAVLRDWLASVQQPSGFPHLETEVLDENGGHIYASHPERSGHVTPVDERSFAIIFFDKELLEFAAPYEQHREMWGLRTSYGPQPIPEIVSASTRPQLALMIVLGRGDGARRLPGRRRGGARSAPRRAQVEFRRVGVARPQDPARADPAVCGDARARARAARLSARRSTTGSSTANPRS
jgi:hypothetical protein